MRFDQPRNFFRQATPLAADVPATVKWFNPEKGFGFVTPGNGGPDAFLPASVVEAAGHQSLPDGATLVVDLVQGAKGAQVGVIHSVDVSTATPRAPRREGAGGFRDAPRGGGFRDAPRGGGFRDAPRGGGFRDAPRSGGFRDQGPTEEVEGTVKWFNATKGFGFIAPDDGSRDIFVHATAVERSGLGTLQEQQRVRASVRQGQKGPEAVSLSAL